MTTRPATPTATPAHAHDHDDASRPVGWYRDPEHPLHHRYWTGQQWIEDTAVATPPEPRVPPAA